jgi:hypothetical protein
MITNHLSPEELQALEKLRSEVFPTYSSEAVAKKLLRDALIGAGVLPLGSANRSRHAGRR